MFYDTRGKELNWNDFLSYYEPFYFLPSKSDFSVKIKNKTSPFIENKIEKILVDGLNEKDIIFIIAWKLGEIKHSESEKSKQIEYQREFNINLTNWRGYNFCDMVRYLNIKFERLSELAQSKQYEKLFSDLCINRVSGFGTTYIINLMFFFSKGELPIYDAYVSCALNALRNKYKPDKTCVVKITNIPQLNKGHQNHIDKAWNFYQNYIKELKTISGSDNITRTMDRALWVYGHCFNNQGTSGRCRY
jgi:hypothetical protein